MSTEVELRALEQQLLQESYEERAELRERIVQQSHKLLEAAESVQKLSSSAKQLLKVLCDIKEVAVGPLLQRNGDNDGVETLTRRQRRWLIEMVLAEGHIQTAILLDNQSLLVGEWLKCHINEDCEVYLKLLAINTKCTNIEELLSDYLDVECSSKRLLEILKSLQTIKSVTISPNDDCIIPTLLNIRLKPQTVSLELQFTDDELYNLVKQRESTMASDIIRSINHCTDNATLIEVLLRADKEFETPRPELVEFINDRMDGVDSCEDLLQFVANIPAKYQSECVGKVLDRLEQCDETIAINPDLFKNEKIRDRLVRLQSDNFEKMIIQRLDESSNPIKVLFEAQVLSQYSISATSPLWSRMQTMIDADDLAAMRLLLQPFIIKTTDLKSPKQGRFDMLPSPDSMPHLPKIPVKRMEKLTSSAQIPSPTSPPMALPPAGSATAKPAIDPLQALKKILPY